jgi:AcrR family transcriptional regulator
VATPAQTRWPRDTQRQTAQPRGFAPDHELRVRHAVVSAVGEALATRGYHATTYDYIAALAGCRPADVRRAFPSKKGLILEALRLPEALGSVPELLRLPGEELVTRYLEFWETADNAVILGCVFRAAVSDERVAAALERYLADALVGPLAAGLETTDAYPRVRLLISYLVGLTMSRYILAEEPLASADRETVAAWAGPSVDGFLHRRLGAA